MTYSVSMNLRGNMKKAEKLAIELLFAVTNNNIPEAIRLVDELKILMDTYKGAC